MFKYLYFYKNQNNSNFFFHDEKDILDSENHFDALISEIDARTWESDSQNYPNLNFPLPEYILEGFKKPLYDLLKKSTDHSYDELNKNFLKVDIALFMLNDYQDCEIEEYDNYFNELKKIKNDFICLNKHLNSINTIEDFYKFKLSLLPGLENKNNLKNISLAIKDLNVDNSFDFSSDLSTAESFLNNSK